MATLFRSYGAKEVGHEGQIEFRENQNPIWQYGLQVPKNI